LKTVEEIKAAIEVAVPALGGDCAQPKRERPAFAAAGAEPRIRGGDVSARRCELSLDFLSNATGVDWPDKEIAEKVKVMRTVTKTVDGVEQQVEETVEETKKRVVPGCLSCVSPVSVAKGMGGGDPDEDREPDRPCAAAFLTPIWRSAEFQEREIFDLFGIVFTGHPDLRRLLMWTSSRTTRCGGITWSRTILNMSRQRTTKC